METISDRISRRMDVLDLSNVDVAVACGVTPRAVSNWRHNADGLRAVRLVRLARVLRCHVSYLLGTRRRP